MLDEIDQLRERLNEMIYNKDEDPENILKISQELDLLIVEYYKEESDERIDNSEDL